MLRKLLFLDISYAFEVPSFFAIYTFDPADIVTVFQDNPFKFISLVHQPIQILSITFTTVTRPL